MFYQNNRLNRLGFITETSGEINLHIQKIIQTSTGNKKNILNTEEKSRVFEAGETFVKELIKYKLHSKLQVWG